MMIRWTVCAALFDMQHKRLHGHERDGWRLDAEIKKTICFAIQAIPESTCLAVNLDCARLYDEDMAGILVLETSWILSPRRRI